MVDVALLRCFERERRHNHHVDFLPEEFRGEPREGIDGAIGSSEFNVKRFSLNVAEGSQALPHCVGTEILIANRPREHADAPDLPYGLRLGGDRRSKCSSQRR